jgi:hypothetical protein
MVELKIEAKPESLEELRQMLESELGDGVNVQEISSSATTELREPLLIALIVAMGGPVVVKQAAGVIKRWMQHQETLTDLSVKAQKSAQQFELAKLRLLTQKDARTISIEDLESFSSTST